MRAHYDVTLRRNNKELAVVAERAHVPREGAEIIIPSRSFDDCLKGGIPILLFMKYNIRMKPVQCKSLHYNENESLVSLSRWDHGELYCRRGRELANNRPSDQLCGRTEVSRMGYPVRMLERTRTRTKPQPRPTTHPLNFWGSRTYSSYSKVTK